MVERLQIPTEKGQLEGYTLLHGKVFHEPFRVMAVHFHTREEYSDGIKYPAFFGEQASVNMVDLTPTDHNTKKGTVRLIEWRNRALDKNPEDIRYQFKINEAVEYAAHEEGHDKHVIVIARRGEKLLLPPPRLPLTEANRFFNYQGHLLVAAHPGFANYSVSIDDIRRLHSDPETAFHAVEDFNAASAKSFAFRENWKDHPILNVVFDRFSELPRMHSNAIVQQFMKKEGYVMGLQSFTGSDGHGRNDFLDVVMTYPESMDFVDAVRTGNVGHYQRNVMSKTDALYMAELKTVTTYDALRYKAKNAVRRLK